MTNDNTTQNHSWQRTNNTVPAPLVNAPTLVLDTSYREYHYKTETIRNLNLSSFTSVLEIPS